MRKRLQIVLICIMMVLGIGTFCSSASERIVFNGPDYNNGQAQWDTIYFGEYPQTEVDNSNGDYTKLKNAKFSNDGDTTIDNVKFKRVKTDDGYRYFRYEPIKWRILKIEDNDFLLLSEDILFSGAYNINKEDITWENSTLRKVLNSSFINDAFSEAEQSSIKLSYARNNDSLAYDVTGGNNTKDKIFLLSESDVYSGKGYKYGFANEYKEFDKGRQAIPTEYAKATGVWVYQSDSYKGNCYWWLRSPGVNSKNAANIGVNGRLYRSGMVNLEYGIRPCLHVCVDKLGSFTYAGRFTAEGSKINNECLHALEKTKTVKPTYKIKGYTEFDCKNCGKIYRCAYKDRLKLAKVTNIKKKSLANKKLTLTFNKVTGASGYTIMYKKGSGTWKTKTVTANCVSLANLSYGSTYSIKIRAYTKNSSGEIVNTGEWSAVKKYSVNKEKA